MTHVIPDRPSRVRLGEDQELHRAMMRPTPDVWHKERYDLLSLTQFRHNAEQGGRIVGIILHWMFVKPFQLLMFVFYFIQQVVVNIQAILTTTLIGMVVYLVCWIVILAVKGNLE